jgi:hypothetical protein
MNQSNRTIKDIAWEYIEFIDRLGDKKCVSYRTIFFYPEAYYGSRENFIKELNANELASFKNKHGDRIVSDEIIEDLMLAKQYAFSSSQNKKQQFRCKVVITLSPLNEDFKIEVATRIDCISNEYLKLSEEDYQDYLLDVASDKIFEEYPLDEIQEKGISYGFSECQPL